MDDETQPTTDAEEVLIRKASKGSLEAFNQLVLRYQNTAYQHAYALTGEPETAEDITQESFIKAFRSIHNYRGGYFRAWLMRIVTNTAYDLLRKSKVHPVQPLFPEDDDGEEFDSPAWMSSPADSVERAVEQNEESQRLYRLIDELPDNHRSVLTLVDIYEMDYDEAAAILQIPVGTVKSRLARARLQMRSLIQGDSGLFHRFRQAIPSMQT